MTTATKITSDGRGVTGSPAAPGRGRPAVLNERRIVARATMYSLQPRRDPRSCDDCGRIVNARTDLLHFGSVLEYCPACAWAKFWAHLDRATLPRVVDTDPRDLDRALEVISRTGGAPPIVRDGAA